MVNYNPYWWLFALLSAIFAALTTIFAKIGVESVNSNLATAIRTVVILGIAWSFVWAEKQFHALFDIPQKTLLFLILSGVTTGLSWLFYFKALQMAPASWVAPIDKSSLVFVIVFAALFLNEPFTLKSVLATGLMTIGILILVI
jgi:bacterial/archaeal transporter family protein